MTFVIFLLFVGPIITISSEPHHEQVSHSDLIAMVHALLVSVDTLEKENQKLREEIELLNRVKPNSQHSSQPQSRDQKPNARVVSKNDRKIGKKSQIGVLIAHP